MLFHVGKVPYSTTSTMWCTVLIIPRISGVSSCSTTRCSLLRPRPIRTLRWDSGRRMGDPTCLILIFAISLTPPQLRRRPERRLRKPRHDGADRRLSCRDVEPPTLDWSRSEEHTSELQSLMRISYAVLCLKKNKIF